MKRTTCLLLLLLCACIDVDDFGTTWDKGYSDPCITAIAKEIYVDKDYTGDVDKLVHNLALGPHHFLLMKDKPENKGGSMVRYEVKNGQYITYVLRSEKREEFQKNYPQSGVVFTTETATLPVLDDKAVALAKEIAGKPDYWEETDRETYNPKKNPACKL